VLGILKADLQQQLTHYVVTHREEITNVIETWWDKYRKTLREIEHEENTSRARLDEFLLELGYER